jgi:hypothetical protein
MIDCRGARPPMDGRLQAARKVRGMDGPNQHREAVSFGGHAPPKR